MFTFFLHNLSNGEKGLDIGIYSTILVSNYFNFLKYNIYYEYEKTKVAYNL